MELIVQVVQKLSQARDIQTIMRIVRTAARDLTGADGATFILKDGDMCYYAEEDAISPLWKNRKFPMEACISGWVMQNGQSVVIDDIYQDKRIPADVYRPTFVHSLAMVPIRRSSPIGAIGNYWASNYSASQEEINLLQALADTTCVAMENVGVYQNLEEMVKKRTRELHQEIEKNRMLMRELQHRVKNNLTMVSSFIGLAEPKIIDKKAQTTLKETRHRIETVSEIYKILHQRGDINRLELGSYIKQLALSIIQSFGGEESGIHLITDVITVKSDIQTAVIAGLITNELLTNAVKHAFPDQKEGTIELNLQQSKEGALMLTIADTGTGIPQEISKDNSDGLTLVNLLSEQLGGTVTIDSAHGTRIIVTFHSKVTPD
jgi:hypothetical protein